MYESIKNMSDVELYDKLSLDKKNSRLAFDELYNRHSQRIFTYCRKYISNQSAAEDIFQDVFTKLYTSSQRGDKIQNVVGFLMTVARNLCYNEVHRKRAVTTGHDNLDMPYYDNTFENVDLKNIIDMAIETLPDKLKELIILKEYMDMTYKEISDALSMPLSSVRVGIYRAKDKLRSILAPYMNELEK